MLIMIKQFIKNTFLISKTNTHLMLNQKVKFLMGKGNLGTSVHSVYIRKLLEPFKHILFQPLSSFRIFFFTGF